MAWGWVLSCLLLAVKSGHGIYYLLCCSRQQAFPKEVTIRFRLRKMLWEMTDAVGNAEQATVKD